MALELASGDVLSHMTDTKSKTEEGDKTGEDNPHDCRQNCSRVSKRGRQCGSCRCGNPHTRTCAP